MPETPEARMAAALKELARKARDGSAGDVEACVSTLVAVNIKCDRATFLKRCAASGIGSALGPRLWRELGARRIAGKPKDR